MRRLTLTEVKEHYGGVLPPDAVLRSDTEEPPPPITPRTTARTSKAKPTRRGERFAVLNSFADYSLAGLTGAEVKVWLILFRDTKGTGTARTGQTDLARRAGLSPRGVRKALTALQAKGLVCVTYCGRLNAGPSVYRVHPA